jgi:diaminopimelate epimerase
MHFQKYQAVGNDFLIVRESELQNGRGPMGETARWMCDRHRGPGADGLEVILDARPAEADFSIRIFNADGSETPISGNGTRCAAAFLYFNDLWTESSVRIETGAGIRVLKLNERSGATFVFETEMGHPLLSSEDIPILLPSPLARVVSLPLDIGIERVIFTACSMGNPHCTIFVDSFEEDSWHSLGAEIESHPAFPLRTNVEFVRVLDRDRIEVRFWERGVGPTLSSGTGSSAAAVACMLNEKTDSRVVVVTEGGELLVEWSEGRGVVQTGEVIAVYRGNTIS